MTSLNVTFSEATPAGRSTRVTARVRAMLTLALAFGLSGAAAAHPGGGFGPMMLPGPPAVLPPPQPPHIPNPPHVPNVPHVPAESAVRTSGANTVRRSVAASEKRLSDVRVEQAKKSVVANPRLFETDRHGAMAIRGEIMAVGFRPASLNRFRAAGFNLLRDEEMTGVDMRVVILSKQGERTGKAIRELQHIDPQGTYDYNHVFFPSGVAGEPREGASSPQTSSAGYEVGLIDTGVEATVGPLRGAAIIQRAFASTTPVPANHGTQVAAILRGRPGPGAIRKIYAADVYGNNPAGGSAEFLVSGLNWIARERVPVINVSLVGPANLIVAAVVRAMLQRGYLIVAPVGNDGPQARPLYPASYPGVVAVSGITGDSRILPEASRGSRVDFVAPGIATAPDISGREVMVRGTSFAAPVVSRHLAAYVSTPDPEAAKKALRRLVNATTRPRGTSHPREFGMGVVTP